jgi:hypothetical protein
MQQAQWLGVFIAGCVAVWVVLDARKRGKSTGVALGWGMGVFLLLLLFLPLYLVLRDKTVAAPAKSETASCRYCNMNVPLNAAYCPHCSKQLQGSESIHRRT